MKLTINNHTCRIQAITTSEIEALNKLDEEFSIPVPNYWFSPKYRRGLWDGKYHPIRVRGTSARFETGFLNEVLDHLESLKVKVTAEDNRDLPDVKTLAEIIHPEILEGKILRDYQVEAAKVVIRKVRGILALATNAGKTLIAAAVLATLRKPSLHLAPNKDVLSQTFKDFVQHMPSPQSIGRAEGGKLEEGLIVVGLPQTLANTKKFKSFLSKVEVVIVDECHHMKATTWLKVMSACKRAAFRVGLSGTPYADEIAERKLTGATGEILMTVSNEYLINKGYSAKPIFLFLKNVQPEIEYLSYEEAYKEGIVRSTSRNQRIVEMCTTVPEKQKLILVWEMEHGRRLFQRLRRQGIEAEFIHGSETMEKRDNVKEDFKKGKLKTLIASTIFDEGIDIPNIEILVLAAGWKTPMRFLQRVGRAMRAKKVGANAVIIVDFLDMSNYYLLEHSKNRYDTAKAEGFQIEVEE